MSLRVAGERMKVVARALSAYGTDYAWDGGHDPHRVGPSLATPEPKGGIPFNLYKGSIGFDCSGFVRYAFHGIDPTLGGPPLPTTGQIHKTVPITRSQLQPGDLIFYGKGNDHVAIYLGNGKIVDAPQTFVSGGTRGPRDFVRIEHIDYPGGGDHPSPHKSKSFVYDYGRSEQFTSQR
jgi:cell wall-associated NlpC family hydrolase